MVYTLTFNPALDYILRVEKLENGKTNRSSSEEIQYGGKGINVSVILKRLGIDNIALGFIGGFTGEALDEMLVKEGIKTDFIKAQGNTRINVKIKADRETEINALGPQIDDMAMNCLFEKLSVLKKGDTLVLAGSIPKGLPPDTYDKILAFLFRKQVRFVIDTFGQLLLQTLKYKPFLIKPNIDELSEIAGKPLETEQEIIDAAKTLQEQGAVNVMVSVGCKGALLIDENGNIHRQKALGGKAVNSVGAGDSMVAGFIAGQSKGYDYALTLASAAAGATACSNSLASYDEIQRILDNI